MLDVTFALEVPFRFLQLDHFSSLPEESVPLVCSTPVYFTPLMQLVCISGTSQQALFTTTSVAFAFGNEASAMQLHHDARGTQTLP
jgi:hypothetical protein